MPDITPALWGYCWTLIKFMTFATLVFALVCLAVRQARRLLFPRLARRGTHRRP